MNFFYVYGDGRIEVKRDKKTSDAFTVESRNIGGRMWELICVCEDHTPGLGFTEIKLGNKIIIFHERRRYEEGINGTPMATEVVRRCLAWRDNAYDDFAEVMNGGSV